MAVLKIPVDSAAPWYEETIALDGASYLLTCTYNDRDQSWYLDVAQADGTPIGCMTGVKLVVDFPIAYRSTDPAAPPGTFVLVDTSGNHLDPGATDLGARVSLLYFERASLPVVPLT